MEFDKEHLRALKNAIRLDKKAGVGQQGAEGMSPLTWAAEVEYRAPRGSLSGEKLNRVAVREYCQMHKHTPEHCFITVMAWGGRGLKAHYRRSSWDARRCWRDSVGRLRTQGMGRSAAYEMLWSLKRYGPGRLNHLPGIGPAFFTKLIFFMRPSPDGFIMDQWLGKSINLLAGERVVRMDGDCASLRNTPDDYEAFCRVVDELGRKLGLCPDDTEQALFSRGGRNPGPWRQYVKRHSGDRQANCRSG